MYIKNIRQQLRRVCRRGGAFDDRWHIGIYQEGCKARHEHRPNRPTRDWITTYWRPIYRTVYIYNIYIDIFTHSWSCRHGDRRVFGAHWRQFVHIKVHHGTDRYYWWGYCTIIMDGHFSVCLHISIWNIVVGYLCTIAMARYKMYACFFTIYIYIYGSRKSILLRDAILARLRERIVALEPSQSLVPRIKKRKKQHAARTRQETSNSIRKTKTKIRGTMDATTSFGVPRGTTNRMCHANPMHGKCASILQDEDDDYDAREWVWIVVVCMVRIHTQTLEI